MDTFKSVQYAFADHLRDPQQHPFDEGIETRRLNVYRELFFNNIQGFLDNGFPVLASLYEPQDWTRLARAFFANHPCRSPYFVEISKEFVEFLSNEYTPEPSDPPFLAELAHYEWLELDVSVRRSEQTPSIWQGGTLPERVQLSALASVVSYAFPVHQISVDVQPEAPDGPYYLVVYRNDQDAVGFTLLNPVSAHMLTVVQEQEQERMSIDELAEQMTQSLPQLDPQQVRQGLMQTLELMLSEQILLPG